MTRPTKMIRDIETIIGQYKRGNITSATATTKIRKLWPTCVRARPRKRR